MHIPTPELTLQIARWALTGETGTSALFMAGVAVFGPSHTNRHGELDLPGDFDDLRRCMQMVQACPEYHVVWPTLALVSPAWNEFVERRAEIYNLVFPAPDHQLLTQTARYEAYRAILQEIATKLKDHPDPHNHGR